MVLDAFIDASPGLTVPADTGSLSGDLKAFLRSAQSMIERAGRRTLLSLLAELDRSAGEAVRDLLFARGAEVIEPLLDRARRRGELGDSPLPPRVAAAGPGSRPPRGAHRWRVGRRRRSVTIVDEIVVPLLAARQLSGVATTSQ